MDKSALKLWQVDDGETHFVVAVDELDAYKVLVEVQISDAPDVDVYKRLYDPSANQLPSDFQLGIDDDGVKRRMSAAEWIVDNGRGYLAGTCW